MLNQERPKRQRKRRKAPVQVPETAPEEIYVRVAEPEDEAGILELARLVHHENGLFALNEAKVVAMLRPALYRIRGICGVIGEQGKLTGVILLRVSNYWYSDTEFIEEMCIYVHPDYRHAAGGRARHLIEFAKKTADSLKMPLAIGVLSNDRTDAKIALYERHFGPQAGAFFLYGAKTGHNTLN